MGKWNLNGKRILRMGNPILEKDDDEMECR